MKRSAVRRGTTLRVLGITVTLNEALKEAAERDLGLRLEFLPLDGTLAQRAAVMRPDSFDIYDQWFHDIDLTWPARSLQPIEPERIRAWDGLDVYPKSGQTGLHRRVTPGGDPADRLHVQLDGKLGRVRSERVSMLPTVHNADGFALIGSEETDGLGSWADLFDPASTRATALQGDAAIGLVDAVLALTAGGDFRCDDPGNLTLAEIDTLVDRLDAHCRSGRLRAFWRDEHDVASRLAGGDEPMLSSMWWAGLVRLRARGVKARMIAPKEGCRGWFGGSGLSAELDGGTREAAYEYLN